MHFSTVFSVLLATGAIAAPISGLPVDTSTVTNLLTEVESVGVPSLPSLPVRDLGLPVDTSTVTNLVSEVEKVGVPSLPSLPVRGLGVPALPTLPVDTSEVTGVLGEVTDLTSGTGLRRKSSIDLTGTLSSVDSILGNVLTLVNEIKTDVDSLVSAVETLNVGSIISTVEGLLTQVISSLDTIPSGEGINLGLSSLTPTLSAVTNELGVVSQTVSSLTDSGVEAQSLTEVKSLLAQALSLANGVQL